jgi:hypothetical protein
VAWARFELYSAYPIVDFAVWIVASQARAALGRRGIAAAASRVLDRRAHAGILHLFRRFALIAVTLHAVDYGGGI